MKMVFHPVPAPDPWIKVGHHPKRTGHNLLQGGAVPFTGYHSRGALCGHVQIEIQLRQKPLLHPVRPAPLRKIPLLVFLPLGQVLLGRAPVGHATAKAQLDFPAGDIRQNQDIPLTHQRRTDAIYQDQAGTYLPDLPAGSLQVLLRKELLQPPGRHDAKHRIVR